MLTTKIYSRCNLIGRACVVFFPLLFFIQEVLRIASIWVSHGLWRNFFFQLPLLLLLFLTHILQCVVFASWRYIFFFYMPRHGFVFLSRLALYTRFLSIAGLCYVHINKIENPSRHWVWRGVEMRPFCSLVLRVKCFDILNSFLKLQNFIFIIF